MTQNHNEIQDFLAASSIRAETHSPLFHIIKIQDHISSLRKEVEPFRNHFFEISYTSGFNVECRLNDQTYNQVEDNLLFVCPGQINSWRIRQPLGPAKGYMMFIKPELFGGDAKLFEMISTFHFFNLNAQPIYYLSEENKKLFEDLYSRIYNEYQNFRKGSLEIITSYLVILLNEAGRSLKPGFMDDDAISRAAEITYEFEKRIKSSLHKKKTIQEYAEELFLSPSYLRESVKKTTGKPANKIIQEYTILEAKSLLQQSEGSVKSVALELGFDDPSNFAKFFKKQTGLTPLRYRQNPQNVPESRQFG
jgi:AraC family transcriptional regulator, transcriptional activator of pobA